jgi:hypothetical protein
VRRGPKGLLGGWRGWFEKFANLVQAMYSKRNRTCTFCWVKKEIERTYKENQHLHLLPGFKNIKGTWKRPCSVKKPALAPPAGF